MTFYKSSLISNGYYPYIFTFQLDSLLSISFWDGSHLVSAEYSYKSMFGNISALAGIVL